MTKDLYGRTFEDITQDHENRIHKLEQAQTNREWWIVGGCEAWDNEKDARYYAVDRPIVHVREVKE